MNSFCGDYPSPEEEYKVKFMKKRGGYKIIRYTGVGEEIIIPKEINGEAVLALERLAEYNRRTRRYEGGRDLISVAIPNSIVEIDYQAFRGCRGLINIVVNADNENFMVEGGILFNKDKSVLLKYPQGKSYNEYKIPGGVTEIGTDAFNGCVYLENVTIPDSVVILNVQRCQLVQRYPITFKIGFDVALYNIVV